jgi:hypothetical protein
LKVMPQDRGAGEIKQLLDKGRKTSERIVTFSALHMFVCNNFEVNNMINLLYKALFMN